MGQCIEIDLVAGPRDDRVDLREITCERLQQCAHGGGDGPRPSIAGGEPTQHIDTFADRVCRRAQSFMRQRLPAGKDRRRASAE